MPADVLRSLVRCNQVLQGVHLRGKCSVRACIYVSEAFFWLAQLGNVFTAARQYSQYHAEGWREFLNGRMSEDNWCVSVKSDVCIRRV